ncbi:hypothetical protein BUALT_Bualt10G0096300 [Buddleja alternifolia]|uniref:Premnaspirodiene oxygenase-like n=1 Tax=Buddleja alternifolia TaxID=168488 RepID=A0AAV6WWL2_9LAMI|nr:hypothetical protein BUALT_Bualt10G0096300 [Buddleja alternifolia]
MEMQFLVSLILYPFKFLFLFLLLNEYKNSELRQKLPPGPWKLPVLGNLHQLIGLRSLPHHALKTLAQKYGPIMSIKLGDLQTIVVSSPNIAKKITKTNDVAFADRVDLMIAKIVLYNSSDIASTPYGEYWRQMRKLCVLEFLNHKKVRSFHSLMENEVLRLVDSVRVSEGFPINLTEMILSVECRIICRSTVGRVWKVDQESLLIQIIKEAVSIAGVFNFADVFPSMKFLHCLSAGSKRRLEKMHDKIDCVLEDIIQQHEEKRVSSGSGDQSMEVEDIVDVLLRVSERKDLQVPITRDNIKANIFVSILFHLLFFSYVYQCVSAV